MKKLLEPIWSDYELIATEIRLLSVSARLSGRCFNQLIDIVDFHHTIFNKRIDFFNCNNLSKHITQPLWIQKVKITQCGIVVVKQYTVFV